MKGLITGLAGAVSILAMTASPASAAIVCNDEGDCWHVREHNWIRPELRLNVHPDNWRWRDHDHDRYRWREHEGRGYWRGGDWIEIR